MSSISKYIVALWRNKFYEEGGRKPLYTGTFTAPRDLKAGEQVRVSVWKNDRPDANPKAPQLSGQEDTFVKSGDSPAPKQPAGDDAPW